MHINEFVDKVFLINLKKRSDRLEKMTNELNKYNIEFEVIEAIDGQLIGIGGTEGCKQSHLKAIKIAKDRGYKKILVLEDDCLFLKNWEEMFSAGVNELPSDFGMFYLGYTGCIYKDGSENLVSVIRLITNHAYIINSNCFEKLEHIGKLSGNIAIDVAYANFMKDLNVYALPKSAIRQLNGISDTRNYVYDFDHYGDDFWNARKI